MSDTAGIGHNLGPDADDFRARLETDHADLLDAASDLEIDSFALPKDVASDEDVAKINAFVLRDQDLVRRLESARKDTKEPYLRRGQTVDDFFNGEKKTLAEKLTAISRRSVAYLQAEQARERAEAEERAKVQRMEAQRLLDEAQTAQRRQDEARLAQAAAEQKVRDDEAARARQESDARAAGADEEVVALAPRQNEEALRRANADAEAAARDRERAEEDARRAQATATRAERAADSNMLGKTQGGGGSAKIRSVWTAHVTDYVLLTRSLGPLGIFIGSADITEALARAAKSKERPPVPGVEYEEVPEARVTATRGVP